VNQEPWAGHVRPLSEMDDATIAAFVARDLELWALAETEPFRAVQQAIGDRVFFRAGAPRFGEPVYRSEQAAEDDQRNMYCGRSTGHLGTGLYFFGTLTAAAAAPRSPSTVLGGAGDPYAAPHRRASLEALVRERRSDVWVVDMEHVPDERIFMPDAAATQHTHDFAKALLCWEPERRRAEHARDAVATGQESLQAAQAALDLEDTDEAFYDAEDAKDAVREARRSFRSALADLERLLSDLESCPVRRVRPNGFIEDLLDVIEETKGLPARPAPAYVEPVPAPELPPVDFSIPRPPPAVAEAIRRYLDDTEVRRFPGFHPMTYYMAEVGYEAVLHASWGEFNSGGKGNIWYPVVRQGPAG